MNRNAVLDTLRAHEADLKASGIVHLSLFGSVARDAAGPESDVDLLAAFDAGRPLSLLDILRLQNALSDLLGRSVDLIEEGTLKSSIQQKVECEAVRAF